MANCLNIPIETLSQLLVADFEKGKLYWRARPERKAFTTRWCGKEAITHKHESCFMGSILQIRVKAHRVLWAMHTGKWPELTIDHINGDHYDNRIENLREVTQGVNSKNQRLRSTNTSGQMGVCWATRYKIWTCNIKVDGELIFLGNFKVKEDAIAARKVAELKYGFHPNHGRKP